MKQTDLFGNEITQNENDKYTSKVKAPIYEPKNKKPYTLELYDNSKTKRLITQIQNSDIDEDVKKFLIQAAHRHTVFNYEKIADFYAHSSKDIQQLMEHSALVIIDFDKALQYGYVKLSEEMTQQYLKETK